MEDNNNDSYFWPSYVDFVMVLFFIALAIGGYMSTYKSKFENSERKLLDEKASTLSTNQKLIILEKYRTLVNEVIGITESLKDELAENGIELDSSNREKIKIAGDFLFDKNSFTLKYGMIDTVIKIGYSFRKVLGKNYNYTKYAILVEGHTDSDGESEYNNDLSFKRASAITEVWANRCDLQLPKYEVLPAGYGELKPCSDNISENGKALNRRIEISIIPKLSEFANLIQSYKLNSE